MQKLPNAMIVMLQSDKNYLGDLDTNSFAFHHFDIEMMKCEVIQDSRRYNSKIVDITDDINKIIKKIELQQVFQENAECRGISKRQFNNANDRYLQPMLNLTTYLEDKGLVVFTKNLDPEVTTEDETTTLSVGPMRLRIQFKEPLEDTIKCVVHVIQDGQFEYSFSQSKFAWSYSTNVSVKTINRQCQNKHKQRDFQSLKQYAQTQHPDHFKGIYFIDQYENYDMLTHPYDFMIVNTGTSRSNGEHWICVRLQTTNCYELIDSEYVPSLVNETLIGDKTKPQRQNHIVPKFIYKLPTNYICGEYVLYFLDIK